MTRFGATELYLKEMSGATTSEQRRELARTFNDRHGLCGSCDGTGRDTWDRVTTECWPCNGTGKRQEKK